jgi:hypothetical protein
LQTPWIAAHFWRALPGPIEHPLHRLIPTGVEKDPNAEKGHNHNLVK